MSNEITWYLRIYFWYICLTLSKTNIHYIVQYIFCIVYKYWLWNSREKGITTLRIYQYWIFHHTVIETCFEMVKSSEHINLPIFSIVWSFLAGPSISIYYPFRTFSISIPWLWCNSRFSPPLEFLTQYRFQYQSKIEKKDILEI